MLELISPSIHFSQPLVEQVALTASLEVGLMNSFPPSPTRHRRESAQTEDII